MALLGLGLGLKRSLCGVDVGFKLGVRGVDVGVQCRVCGRQGCSEGDMLRSRGRHQAAHMLGRFVLGEVRMDSIRCGYEVLVP